jgi:hypothetical protein
MLFSLTIFRWLYDLRWAVTVPMTAIWLLVGSWLLWRRSRRFFLWLAVLPLFILPLSMGMTWCGWHYRMELRQRYATLPDDSDAYDIDRMPPKIRAEYARNDYHPRLRDIKAQAVSTIALTPILYIAGFLLFACVRRQYQAPGQESTDNA